MAQVAECLPSKCEALSSNPSTKKKKKRSDNEEGDMNGKDSNIITITCKMLDYLQNSVITVNLSVLWEAGLF
jgi:hypothetical protein